MHESWAVLNIQASSKNSHKEGWSAINEVAARENTINIHKCTHGSMPLGHAKKPGNSP